MLRSICAIRGIVIMTRIIERVVAKKRERQSTWSDLSINSIENINVSSFLTEYVGIWFQYTEAGNTHHFNATSSLLNESIHNVSLMNYLTNLVIDEPISGEIEMITNRVNSADAHVANIDIDLTKMGSHPENKWTRKEKRDLLIKKDGVPNRYLFENTLISINGHLHRTSLSRHGVYVIDGAYGLHNANIADMSIISFKDVGGVSTVNVDSNMILPVDGIEPYQNTYLDVGVSLKDKTVGLSLAGRLYILDGICDVTDDNVVRIKMELIPHVQNYFESMEVIDHSNYPFTEYQYDPNRRKVSEIIQSNDWIMHLLDQPTSFLVVINNPNIVRRDMRLESAKLASTYYAHQNPVGFILGMRNLAVNYVTYHEDGVWVIKCSDDRLPAYKFETIDWESKDSISNTKLSIRPYREATMRLVQLIDIEVK